MSKKGRRNFLKKSTLYVAGALTLPRRANSVSTAPSVKKSKIIRVSDLRKPLAIAMWDYSWILRHHRYGKFEDWDNVLEGLAERGYNAIRMDAMPQFVAAGAQGNVQKEFRAVKDGWKPPLWGNKYTMSFSPREALLEFLPKCKKYGVSVGLATWFMRHGTSRTDIFMEEGGLLRAWDETLSFLQTENLLDNIIYVDLLNEYPFWHGYDWLKNELNKRSDIKKFKLDNPEANLPDADNTKESASLLRQEFYNRFINNLTSTLKGRCPGIDFFASLDSGMELDRIDLSHFDAMDYHIWFAHTGLVPGLGEIAARDQAADLRKFNKLVKTYWKENKKFLIEWMDGQITAISNTAARNGIVCGNTEGWGPIFWYDHPELDWRWTKESAEICVDLALEHDNYKFICTSNFTHPQFKGMWDDLKWHKQITSKIKSE